MARTLDPLDSMTASFRWSQGQAGLGTALAAPAMQPSQITVTKRVRGVPGPHVIEVNMADPGSIDDSRPWGPAIRVPRSRY